MDYYIASAALGRAKIIAPAQARRKGVAESARHHLGSCYETGKAPVSQLRNLLLLHRCASFEAKEMDQILFDHFLA
jgi:hypothetical protein